MFLFIDSSVLCSDYFMKGINFSLIERAGFNIILSEIVVSEVKNKYRESLQEEIKKANSALKNIKCFGLEVSEISTDSIGNAIDKYSDFLDIFVIKSGMSFPEPYPNVSHESIVNRALSRKKPFKKDGRNGYRDYLVWQSFLKFVIGTENETDYYFLTLNHSDFSDDSDVNRLHPDLQEEISALTLGNKRVHYYSKLGEFVAKIITPRLEDIQDNERLSELLLNSKEAFVLPVTRFIESELNNLEITRYEIPFWGDNPDITEIADVEIENVESILKTAQEEYRIQLSASAYIIFNSYIKKSELALLSKKELKHINILNSNWNYCLASIENNVILNIEVEVLLTITQYGTNSTDFMIKLSTIELADISDSSYCPYCPEYDEEDEDI